MGLNIERPLTHNFLIGEISSLIMPALHDQSEPLHPLDPSLAHLTLSASALTILGQCPRLFRYIYIDHLIWPATQLTQDPEDFESGRIFHRLVELYTKGHSLDSQLKVIAPPVQQWWQQFLASSHQQPLGHVKSEIPIWVTIDGFRIMAKFDRLVITPHHIHIIDWKTHQTRPQDYVLRQQWQVKLYPLIACLASSKLTGQPDFTPEAVTLTFWFANFPDQPFNLHYSQQQFDQDYTVLSANLKYLRHLASDTYPLTQDKTGCGSCLFRSHCYGLAPEHITAAQLHLFEGYEDKSPISRELL